MQQKHTYKRSETVCNQEPLGVALINLGSEPYTVRHGNRIAQMVVAPVVQAAFEVVDLLTETDRGAGGFGSTGLRG